jgi:8-oxo-dGTP pyrophosphatase MutT (NUDIX family)
VSKDVGRRRLVSARRLAYRVGYHVMDAYVRVRGHGPSGVKCVLSHDGEVLAVRHTYGPRAWHLPGGGMRRREEPARAAARELREELGLDVPLQELGIYRVGTRGVRATLHCYGATLGSRAMTPDPVEIAEVTWMTPEALASRLKDWDPPAQVLLAHVGSWSRPGAAQERE